MVHGREVVAIEVYDMDCGGQVFRNDFAYSKRTIMAKCIQCYDSWSRAVLSAEVAFIGIKHGCTWRENTPWKAAQSFATLNLQFAVNRTCGLAELRYADYTSAK